MLTALNVGLLSRLISIVLKWQHSLVQCLLVHISSNPSLFVVVHVYTSYADISTDSPTSVQYARDTQHEKIQRGLALGIAMVSDLILSYSTDS